MKSICSLSILYLLLIFSPSLADSGHTKILMQLDSEDIVGVSTLEAGVPDWDGSNPYLLLTLASGTRAVFRSEDEPWGSIAELVGYRMDQQLGTELVPPTVARTFRKGDLGEFWPWSTTERSGTLQLFIEGAQKADLKQLSRDDLANSEILGFLLGRYDNHSGNLLQSPDGRAVMIDLEGSLDIQKVKYGDFAFVKRGGWFKSEEGLPATSPFPFDTPNVLSDPSLDELKQTFEPWWGQYWAQGMTHLHRLLRGIPERKIPYAIWDNRLWVQVRVQSRHPAYTEYFPERTLEALRTLDEVILKEILVEPFQMTHLRGILERRDQLLQAARNSRIENPEKTWFAEVQ